MKLIDFTISIPHKQQKFCKSVLRNQISAIPIKTSKIGVQPGMNSKTERRKKNLILDHIFLNFQQFSTISIEIIERLRRGMNP